MINPVKNSKRLPSRFLLTVGLLVFSLAAATAIGGFSNFAPLLLSALMLALSANIATGKLLSAKILGYLLLVVGAVNLLGILLGPFYLPRVAWVAYLGALSTYSGRYILFSNEMKQFLISSK
jgi:dihydrodipicolinate synthase/N-acetylneuraminate lyase